MQAADDLAVAPRGKRAVIIQAILDLFQNPAYLEIGVNEGVTFRSINAVQKVAVDPKFLFDYEAAAQTSLNEEFYQITSDEFFSNNVQKYNVIFLDGLHTFDQTLRDFMSATQCLREDGVIVVDDVIPSSYPASLPNHQYAVKVRNAMRLETKDWMGDVYRVVYFIDGYCQQFTLRTVGGCAIVWRKRRVSSELSNKSVRQISELGFDSVLLDSACYNRRSLDALLMELKDRSI